MRAKLHILGLICVLCTVLPIVLFGIGAAIAWGSGCVTSETTCSLIGTWLGTVTANLLASLWLLTFSLPAGAFGLVLALFTRPGPSDQT